MTDETFYAVKCFVWIGLSFLGWLALVVLTSLAWHLTNAFADWIAG